MNYILQIYQLRRSSGGHYSVKIVAHAHVSMKTDRNTSHRIRAAIDSDASHVVNVKPFDSSRQKINISHRSQLQFEERNLSIQKSSA